MPLQTSHPVILPPPAHARGLSGTSGTPASPEFDAGAAAQAGIDLAMARFLDVPPQDERVYFEPVMALDSVALDSRVTAAWTCR